MDIFSIQYAYVYTYIYMMYVCMYMNSLAGKQKGVPNISDQAQQKIWTDCENHENASIDTDSQHPLRKIMIC